MKKSILTTMVLAISTMVGPLAHGVENYLQKEDALGGLVDSQVYDNDTSVGVATTTPSASYKLDVNGFFRASGFLTKNFGAPVAGIIGGHSENTLGATAFGSVIAGGGGSGAAKNEITSYFSVIGGGGSNLVQSIYSVITGGAVNTVSSDSNFSTITGGSWNTVSDEYAVVAGGFHNVASGRYSTAIGGYYNTASGTKSYAMGNQCTASHDNTIVFSAGTTACSSAANSQFKVCAPGGAWFSNAVSGDPIIDRTPYPQDLETAYDAVTSMQRLPDGEYDPYDTSKQLDHWSLAAFVYYEGDDGDPSRNLSATVSAQNEVIKDLIARINQLEQQVAELQKR